MHVAHSSIALLGPYSPWELNGPDARPAATTTAGRWKKEAIDRLGALVLLLILSPLLLTLAVIVRLDGGPALFRQERIGVNRKPFVMYKFRTMVPDAESMLATVLAEAGVAAAPLYKVVQDPRITPHGRWMRRFSLDELPQLLNVVRGEMSLVGPRPQVAFETAAYSERDWRRVLVKPGMTGLWQVSGRCELSWREAVDCDLDYVDNWSLLLDLKILWRTIGVVAGARGAY